MGYKIKFVYRTKGRKFNITFYIKTEECEFTKEQRAIKDRISFDAFTQPYVIHYSKDQVIDYLEQVVKDRVLVLDDGVISGIYMAKLDSIEDIVIEKERYLVKYMPWWKKYIDKSYIVEL